MSKYTIPDFLSNTEFESIIKNELDFKEFTKNGVANFKDNFNLNSNSYLILDLFCSLFAMKKQSLDTTEQISKKLNTCLDALQHPGTFESIVFLFRIFLKVEVDIILVENEELPGKLIIKLKDRPKFRRITLIKSNSNTVFIMKTYKGKALLLLNESDKYYVSNFYSYIRTLVLAGVEIEIKEPDVISNKPNTKI